jgi:Ni,Fe-hydrogenase III small subunit/NAD-dependent dihydropyrimidine dehydrogenase PreA subunit
LRQPFKGLTGNFMQTTKQHPPIRELRLYRINAGSCNGCDVELAATGAVSRFDLGPIGCSFTEDPAQADIVLITGPLTVRVREKVLRLHAQVPEPRLTVAVGVCPISGGVFRDSYAVSGPVDQYLPVHVNVPGCPPRPQAIVAGIARAAALWREGTGGALPAAAPEPFAETESSPADEGRVRGRMRFNAAACVGCRMCEHVCAGGAIRFDEVDAGLKFTLWHNSCAFCGMCGHYCPGKALTVTGEWQLVHRQADKYRLVEQGLVPLVPCADCGTPMIPASAELLRLAYRMVGPEIDRLKTVCTECRQKLGIGGLRR